MIHYKGDNAETNEITGVGFISYVLFKIIVKEGVIYWGAFCGGGGGTGAGGGGVRAHTRTSQVIDLFTRHFSLAVRGLQTPLPLPNLGSLPLFGPGGVIFFIF